MMDQTTLESILKRSPYIPLENRIRPRAIIDAIFSTGREYSSEEQRHIREKVNTAIILATSAHQGVLRKSGEPYITHPYSVAYFLAKMGMDYECVIAGLLHDTVEDTTTTLEEIKDIFNERVAVLVDGVTKLTHLNIAKEEKQAQAFKKLITFAADDIRVIFIKLVDRLHNMMTLDSMPVDKKKRISDETLRFYAPLAHRLGIYWLKEELEAISFYFRYNDAWEEIDQYLRTKYFDSKEVIDVLIEKVEEAVKKNSPKVSALIKDIYGRTKSYYSIYRKTLKIEKSINSLHDILGIRVIINSEDKDDCYLVMAAIHSFNEFTVLNNRFKDYISRQKTNGYMSIHTGVRYKEFFLEIQIRTSAMHTIAEEGNASHWEYKNDVKNKDKTVAWLKEVLQDIADSGSAMSFMTDIETALPLEKISVFTPKGELKTLPEGATLLDFAYAIHGELGDHCIGGSVNGKKVPIYYKLQNKDEAEVEKSKNQNPRGDWLNFVVTHKAKSYIRRYLKKLEKDIYVDKGKEKLREFFKALEKESEFDRLEELSGFRKIADKYSLPRDNRMPVFFVKIATGEIKLRRVVVMLFEKPEFEKLAEKFPKSLGTLKAVDKKKEKAKEVKEKRSLLPIFIKNIGEVRDYHAAKCCNPEIGDPVSIYISQNRGYILHKQNCNTVLKLDPDRVNREVYWYTYNMYHIEFIIEITNIKGSLLDLVRETTDADLNISSLHIDPMDRTERSGLVYLSVSGSDIKQVDKLRTRLKNKKIVLNFSIGNINNS